IVVVVFIVVVIIAATVGRLLRLLLAGIVVVGTTGVVVVVTFIVILIIGVSHHGIATELLTVDADEFIDVSALKSGNGVHAETPGRDAASDHHHDSPSNLGDRGQVEPYSGSKTNASSQSSKSCSLPSLST